jgi:hypothetical protein
MSNKNSPVVDHIITTTEWNTFSVITRENGDVSVDIVCRESGCCDGAEQKRAPLRSARIQLPRHTRRMIIVCDIGIATGVGGVVWGILTLFGM